MTEVRKVKVLYLRSSSSVVVGNAEVEAGLDRNSRNSWLANKGNNDGIAGLNECCGLNRMDASNC